MGFLDKFKGEKQIEKGEYGSAVAGYTTMDSNPILVMINDGVNICATACACCWDAALPDDYNGRKAYIGRRAATGHTSVMEHSNLVFYLKVQIPEVPALVEFLGVGFYLHKCVKPASDGGFHMIFGGSWRAYSDLFLHIKAEEMENNAIYRKVIYTILNYVPKEAMGDLIKQGVFTDDDFMSGDDLSQIATTFSIDKNHRLSQRLNVHNCDSIWQLADNIRYTCSEPWLFTYGDLLPFCSVTIEFNGMSRIITQQLVRHRNGITQESQRYVDYSGAAFNSPALFKPNKYDPKRLYTFTFGGKEFKMNLQTLGEAICGIYPQLKNKLKYGVQALVSEDARGYLPNNTQCGKIFITFTYYTLIKFLQLREDPHAQPEFQMFAKEIGEWFRGQVITNCNIFDALVPVMKMEPDNFFSSPIVHIEESNGNAKMIKAVGQDANEVVETLSEEEYAKLVGSSIKYSDEHPEEVAENSDPVEVTPEEKNNIPWNADGMR